MDSVIRLFTAVLILNQNINTGKEGKKKSGITIVTAVYKILAEFQSSSKDFHAMEIARF